MEEAGAGGDVEEAWGGQFGCGGVGNTLGDVAGVGDGYFDSHNDELQKTDENEKENSGVIDELWEYKEL